MATYPVKYIHNAMRGAPVLSGTAGAGIAMIDAFFLTGFGLTTALSVNVAGGIATATLTSGQTFDPYCVVLVAGATPAELNGEARVLTRSSTSITWATTAADGAATGTITIKVAPVGGWEKVYSGTNKAAYRSTDPLGSGFFLRVDDSNATYMRVRGFESMSDVDTGTGPFPTDAQISGGGYWVKSNQANATAVRYDLFADSRAIVVGIGAYAGTIAAYTGIVARGFGDMIELRPGGDAYSCALSCAANSGVDAAATLGSFDRIESGANAIFMARDLSGIGGAVQSGSVPYVGSNNLLSGLDTTLGNFPSVVDGELKYSRRYIKHIGSQTPRADIPGVLHIPQNNVLSAGVAARDALVGAGALAGRRLVALLGASPGSGLSTTPTACTLIDSTGPWRVE